MSSRVIIIISLHQKAFSPWYEINTRFFIFVVDLFWLLNVLVWSITYFDFLLDDLDLLFRFRFSNDNDLDWAFINDFLGQSCGVINMAISTANKNIFWCSSGLYLFRFSFFYMVTCEFITLGNFGCFIFFKLTHFILLSLCVIILDFLLILVKFWLFLFLHAFDDIVNAKANEKEENNNQEYSY